MERLASLPPTPPPGGTIPWAKPEFWGLEERYLVEALQSTWISGGPFVERLEREFARYNGIEFAAAVSNGTAAIHAAYLAVGLKAGDEVVVPGFGFLAAANIALHMGAMPVFAEVDPQTWCLSPEGVEAALTPKTRLIVPVHTYGNVCAMDPILRVAQRHGIPVIEDAAESFASRYKGRYSGTLGTMGTFSFQATKTISTGEGGMVVTNDRSLYEKVCLYRSHGMLRKRYYWHELPGHNFRLTNLQAALGCAQLEKLPEIIRQRHRVHLRYIAEIGDASGLAMQEFADEVDPLLWAMAVRLDPRIYPQGRDHVLAQLAEAKIETRPGFYTPTAIGFYGASPLPVCDQISRQIISLPTFPSLSDDHIHYICQSLRGLAR